MHNNFLLDNYQKRLFVHNADFHLFSKKDLTGKFRKVFHRQEKICDLKALIYGVFHSFHKVFHRGTRHNPVEKAFILSKNRFGDITQKLTFFRKESKQRNFYKKVNYTF